jgi:large subunit ribosomal protein L15
MRVDDLAPAPGSKKVTRRVGRGTGGRRGKTAGRGTKGQRARNTVARGFEGGQMPLKQRVPKLKGFTNPFRVEYTAVNLDTLSELNDEHGETTISPEVLHAHGIVAKDVFVKILARGEVSAKLDVHTHAVSEAARSAIEAAGGSVTLIELPFKAEGKAGRPAAKGNQFTNR